MYMKIKINRTPINQGHITQINGQSYVQDAQDAPSTYSGSTPCVKVVIQKEASTPARGRAAQKKTNSPTLRGVAAHDRIVPALAPYDQPTHYCAPILVADNTVTVRISPAEDYTSISPVTHTVKAFKEDEINKIVSNLKSAGRYRDLMLFVVCINVGLRFSDFTRLRFGDLINEDGTFKDKVSLVEVKTKGKYEGKKVRTIYLNTAVKQAISLYLSHYECSRDDYLFHSHSNNRSAYGRRPLCYRSCVRIIKNIVNEAGMDSSYNTHSLRKTFGYMYMASHNFEKQSLYTLQEIFNHSTPSMTLRYIGIDDDDIRDAYQINAGGQGLNPHDGSAKFAVVDTPTSKRA